MDNRVGGKSKKLTNSSTIVPAFSWLGYRIIIGTFKPESYNNLYTEYYWYKDWTNEYWKLPKKVIVTAENYRTERSCDDTEWLWHTNLLMFWKFLWDELWCEWNDKKEVFVDKNGDRHPLSKNKVDFTISGPAIWRGGYNSGKPNTINNLFLDAEAGINRVAIKSLLQEGEVTITATSKGLKPANIELKRNP